MDIRAALRGRKNRTGRGVQPLLLGPLIRDMEAGQVPQHYIEEQQFTQENLAQEIIDGREH